jgi:hypothetical protein
MKGRLAITVLCGALALPSAALAKSTTYAPPGNSGVDQYLETVPGSGGGHPTGGSGASSSTGSGNSATAAIPAGTARRLASQGAAGRAVQRLVNSTAPQKATKPAGTPPRPRTKRSLRRDPPDPHPLQ